MPIQHINDTLDSLSVEERIRYIFNCYAPEDILITSSFGTNSSFLLYHISKFENKPDIYFINTGFHFSTTLRYKDDLADLFKLNIIEVKPCFTDHSYSEYEKLWQNNADRCCHLNKIKPLELIKKRFKVWVTGLMAHQSSERKKMAIVEKNGSILKFNPLFDENPQHIAELMKSLKIPAHPLVEHGFDSVGCMQCTDRGAGRSGRWADSGKTECGLHLPVDKKRIRE